MESGPGSTFIHPLGWLRMASVAAPSNSSSLNPLSSAHRVKVMDKAIMTTIATLRRIAGANLLRRALSGDASSIVCGDGSGLPVPARVLGPPGPDSTGFSLPLWIAWNRDTVFMWGMAQSGPGVILHFSL